MLIRFLISISLLVFLSIGCAWENLAPDETDVDRFWEVRMVMEGSVVNYAYYIVAFNFSGDINLKPVAVLDGEDRGRNWEVYYMYGKPGDRPEVAPEPLDFYKGEGGAGQSIGALPYETDEKKRRDDPTKPASELNPLDELPDLFREKIEFVDARITSSPIIEGGPPIPNNTIYMKFNWRGFPEFPSTVNINMMVTSLGVDELSYNPDWEIEAIIWDSFAYDGVSIPLTERDEFYESEFLVEVPAADQFVSGRLPYGNIVDWSLKITE